MIFEDICTGADGRRWVVLTAIGLDDNVVVLHVEWQVRICIVQCDDDVVAICAHVFDVAQQSECARLAFLASVPLDCCGHVFRCYGLAVGEGDAGAQFEGPDRRIRGAFPALGNASVKAAIIVQGNEWLAPE